MNSQPTSYQPLLANEQPGVNSGPAYGNQLNPNVGNAARADYQSGPMGGSMGGGMGGGMANPGLQQNQNASGPGMYPTSSSNAAAMDSNQQSLHDRMSKLESNHSRLQQENQDLHKRLSDYLPGQHQNQNQNQNQNQYPRDGSLYPHAGVGGAGVGAGSGAGVGSGPLSHPNNQYNNSHTNNQQYGQGASANVGRYDGGMLCEQPGCNGQAIAKCQHGVGTCCTPVCGRRLCMNHSMNNSVYNSTGNGMLTYCPMHQQKSTCTVM